LQKLLSGVTKHIVMLACLALEACADDVEKANSISHSKAFVLGSRINLLDDTDSLVSKSNSLLTVWNFQRHYV
jgi:hypothetical protein